MFFQEMCELGASQKENQILETDTLWGYEEHRPKQLELVRGCPDCGQVLIQRMKEI